MPRELVPIEAIANFVDSRYFHNLVAVVDNLHCYYSSKFLEKCLQRKKHEHFVGFLKSYIHTFRFNCIEERQ